MKDFFDSSIPEIHEMMKRGELSSLDLVSAYFERIDQLNPAVNALILVDREHALLAAKKADEALKNGQLLGALHGIPISVKDNIEVVNIATTAGFSPFATNTSTQDAELVSLLRKAGAIIIGKTNLPPLTYDLQTNNALFGRTNNPWDVTRTSGGSSGGCAAAVMSSMSRISFCNDSGGSIRIPAHFCGVYGFKSTLGGMTTSGIITQLQKKPQYLKMRTLLSSGMLALSVDDLKCALEVVRTPKLLSSSELEPELRTLKLLWVDEISGFKVDDEIKRAMNELRARLTEAGVQIHAFRHEAFSFFETIRLWGLLSNYETGAELPSLVRYAGNFIMRRKYSKIPMYMDLLKPISAKKYRKVRLNHEKLKAQFENLLESYDGLIIPASSVLAFPHQQPDRKIGHLGIYTTPLDVNGKKVQYAIATQSYALPFNVLESPVVSLPIALSEKNLPIGIQLVGKKNMDFDLLSVAVMLDQLIPSIGKPRV